MVNPQKNCSLDPDPVKIGNPAKMVGHKKGRTQKWSDTKMVGHKIGSDTKKGGTQKRAGHKKERTQKKCRTQKKLKLTVSLLKVRTEE